MLFSKHYFRYLLLTLILIGISARLLALPAGVKQALRAFDQQDFEKARETVDQLLQETKYQRQSSYWYYRGVIYDQLMRQHITSDSATFYLESALEAYQKTVSLSKKNTQYNSFADINIQAIWTYYLNRSVQYYKVEAFEEALEQLAICEKIYTHIPTNLLYTAIAAHQAEKYKLALEYYERYVKSTAAEPQVYRAIASLTANQLKNPVEAKKILLNAIQKYPWDLNLLEEYYQLLVQNNELETKQKNLQIQLAETPHNATIYYQLAYLCIQNNSYEEAIQYGEKALELVPHQLELTLQLAKLYYNQGAEATNSMVDVPEETFQETGKEIIEQANNYLEKSLIYFEKANKIRPNELDIMKHLLILYTRLNKTEKADQTRRKIKRLKGGVQLLETIEL
jgi:tetratricopeptide (TPR) repeat protein